MAEVRNVHLVKNNDIDDDPVILWIDPGLTNGWAVWEGETFSFCSGQCDFFQLGEMVNDMGNQIGPDLWVGWEHYIVVRGAKSGTPKYSLEAIGALRWICHFNECTVLPAMPSASRKLGDALKLKRVGWYKANQPHSNDAASHLLAYLIRERRVPDHLLGKILPDD